MVGELVFNPEANVEVDCAAGRALVKLDNSASTADAMYNVEVYHGDVEEENRISGQSGIQIVSSGDIAYYATAIPPPVGQILTVVVTATAIRDGSDLGYEAKVVWDQSGVDCPAGFAVQVQVETDCNAGGTQVTLGTPGSDLGARFILTLVVDGVETAFEYDLDADDSNLVVLPIDEDAEWHLEWVATDDSDLDKSFAGSSIQKVFDCEPPAFEPTILTGHACTAAGGVATVLIDNRVSDIDATVEIRLGSELVWGPAVVTAGALSNVIRIPAVDLDTLRIWASPIASDTAISAMAEETVNCPTFDPDALVTVDCGVDRALVVLDNSTSTVDAWFTVEVHRGGVDWASRVEDESGVQLVPAGTAATYSQGLPLVSGEMLSVEIRADAYREGVSLGFDPVVVWNQSVTDCPNGFAIQIYVAADCALGGAKAVFSTVGSEAAVVATANTVVDGTVVGVSTYELSANDTVDVPLLVPDGSKWSLQWSVADAAEPSRVFQGATTTQTLDCEPEEPTPTVPPTTTTTVVEDSVRSPLVDPTDQDERCCGQDDPCDQCCWPLWWFLLVVLAVLLGLLALIGFLAFAVVSLSRHGGGCRGPDDRDPGGSSGRDRDEGVPGAPLDLGFERKENSIKFKWNRAETGNRPTGYLIEGRIGNDWVDILNMIGCETRVAIRASEAEGVNAWRVSGANENGRGRASEEVLVERSITSIAALG